MALRVNEDNFEAEVLQSEIPVLADFYSDSCVPCKRLSPVLAEIEEELSDSLRVVKININFDSALAEKYEVLSAPTLILFKNGNEAEMVSGAVKKAEILELINKGDN
ncbi:MAG: thioredoxin [Ruminococcus sp.]